jgi:hypothetical protein
LADDINTLKNPFQLTRFSNVSDMSERILV